MKFFKSLVRFNICEGKLYNFEIEYQFSLLLLILYFVGVCVCMLLLIIGYIVKIFNYQIFFCVCLGVGYWLGIGENYFS